MNYISLIEPLQRIGAAQQRTAVGETTNWPDNLFADAPALKLDW